MRIDSSRNEFHPKETAVRRLSPIRALLSALRHTTRKVIPDCSLSWRTTRYRKAAPHSLFRILLFVMARRLFIGGNWKCVSGYLLYVMYLERNEGIPY